MPTFLIDIFRRQCTIYCYVFPNVLFQVFLLWRLDKNTKALNVIMMHLNEAVSQYLKFLDSFYSPLPHPKTLVVRRTDKSTIFIDKSDGVDSSQVTIILLNHLTVPDVPLTERQVDYSLIPSKRFVFESLVRHRLLKCCSEEKLI